MGGWVGGWEKGEAYLAFIGEKDVMGLDVPMTIVLLVESEEAWCG